MLTTTQAADRLGVTRFQVTRWITSGLLPATKFGRDWMIEEMALAGFVRPKKTGRPRAHDPRGEQGE